MCEYLWVKSHEICRGSEAALLALGFQWGKQFADEVTGSIITPAVWLLLAAPASPLRSRPSLYELALPAGGG